MDLSALAAVLVVAGAVIATAFRDERVVILGLSLAAVAAALVASPAPGALAVAARVLGAVAAAYLLWATVASGRGRGFGSPIGPLGEFGLAAAAFIIGLSIRPVDPLAGPATAQAAGVAVLALAVAPLAGRDVLRLGTGAMLLTIGCSLLLGAWSGATPPLQHLALSALLIGIAGATCLLAPETQAEAEAAVPAVAAAPARTVEPLMPAREAHRPALRPAAPTPAPRSEPIGRPALDLWQQAPAARQTTQATPSAPAGPAPAVEDAWIEPAPVDRARTERAATPRTWTPDPTADELDGWAAWHTPEPEPSPRPPTGKKPRPDRDKGSGR